LEETFNRFSGLPTDVKAAPGKTAEVVTWVLMLAHTPLNWGVNENLHRAHLRS
jgi:hypothetical protein